MITPILYPITRPRFFIPSRMALVVLALGGSALLWNPAVRAAEDVAVSAEVTAASDNNSYRLFYDKLANDGDWLQTDQYGYVFQPRSAVDDRAWRPYTDGYWAQTDAGWTWVSNENFGWAAYHYGRWANLVDTGWVWVPGAEWSPAYVSWRVSKDHKRVGWAPLPPEARLTRSQAIEGWADNAYDIGPEAYVFIDTNRFGETSYRSHLAPVSQNVTIITETENVTRMNYRTVESREIVYNGGPDVAIIRESGGRPVREMHLEMRPEKAEFFQREDHRGITSVNGDRLIFATAAPDVITSSSIRVSQPARVRQRLTTVNVDRGYRGVGDPSAIDRVRAALRSQSPPAPPQIEREVSAVIRRNGAAVSLPNPMERSGAGAPGAMDRRAEGAATGVPFNAGAAARAAGTAERRGEGAAASGAMDRRGEGAASPAVGVASPAASPVEAASSPAANRRGQRAGRNGAAPSPAAANGSPAGSPAAENAASSPAASPAAEASPAGGRRGGRNRPGASPAAEPNAASPAESAASPVATPKPRASAASETSSPEPDRTGGGNRGERQRQPGVTPRESQPSAAPAAERRGTSSAERETPSAATPRRETEAAAPREARPKPEAAARPNAEEPAQRREKPAAGAGDERKAQAPAAEVAPSRRSSGAGQAEERASGGNGQARPDKKEKPDPAAAEKSKASSAQ